MSDDRLRRELEALERSAPADLPPRPSVGAPRRWLRLAVPAAVMVMAGTLIGLSVPNWLPGGLQSGSRVGELVPVPTGAAPAPSGQPVLCHQALTAGTLVRDPVHGFAVANGDHRTPVRWPNGYVGREGPDGLELLDEAGRVAAREGDFVELGGGQGGEMWFACPGPRVIPTELSGRLEGDPRVEDGCIWLATDVGRRDIAWPAGYDQAFRDGQPVLLRNGAVVARAGDLVTVRGHPALGSDEWVYSCIGFGKYLAGEILEIVAAASPGPENSTPSPTPSMRICMSALAIGVLDADSDGNPVLIIEEGQPPVSIVFSYPDDFVIEPTPVLTIYDRNGKELARQGDEVELGGGFNPDDTIFHACGVVSSGPTPVDPATPASGDATLSLAGTWAECCYIEGAMTYVSLSGPTMLDGRLFKDGDELSLAPGHYSLTLYHRPCNVNCDFLLDAPRGHCTTDLDVVSGSKLRAMILWRIEGPCDVSIDG